MAATGGVLASNGEIYGIPRHATSVLIIDPGTNAVDTGTILVHMDDTAEKWFGGALANVTTARSTVSHTTRNPS